MMHKKAFDELYKGNRSFSVISSVQDYFSQQKSEIDVENMQEEEWNSFISDDCPSAGELKHILYQIKYQILLEKTQRQKHLMIRISQIAAVFILPLMFFFVFKHDSKKNEIDKQHSIVELHCPQGIRTKFTLPDGSNGWLAGGSVLTYVTNFNEHRNVSVDGEAFFSVKRDEKNPFVVKLNDFNVRVLGTKFNVLNYSDEPVSEVVVVSGLVEVNGNAKKFSEKLSANKMLQLEKGTNKVQLSEVNALSYSAWIDGRLEFDNEHLESVCRKIEKFYDVDVELNNKGLENNLLRANVKIGSLEELIKYMTLALPIKYKLIDAEKSQDGDIVRRKLIISKK